MLAMEDFCQLSGRPTEDKYRSSYEKCGRVIKAYSRNVGIDLADNLGIHENAALKMMARIADLKDEFNREVGYSYIPDDMKVVFIGMIDERMSIISVN